MLRLALSLSALLEAFVAVFYYVAEAMTSHWLSWGYLCALLAEPLGLYVFAGYLAMRNVTTAAELVSMTLVLPLYYLSLLLLALLKLDLHQSVFLSNMIYFEFCETVQLWQLALHLCLMSVPLAVLTITHMLTHQTDYFGYFNLIAIFIASGCYVLSIVRIIKHRRALFNLRDHFLTVSVSESESDATYLDYPPIVNLGRRDAQYAL